MTTPPKRTPKRFTDEQKAELTVIVEEAINAVIVSAVTKAIRTELKDAGIRVDGQSNQDAAAADFHFLRKIRLWFEGTSSKVGGALILTIVGGFTWLFVIGAQAFFNKP